MRSCCRRRSSVSSPWMTRSGTTASPRVRRNTDKRASSSARSVGRLCALRRPLRRRRSCATTPVSATRNRPLDTSRGSPARRPPRTPFPPLFRTARGQAGRKASIDIDPSFVPGRPDDRGHLVEGAVLVQRARLIGDVQAVDDRAPGTRAVSANSCWPFAKASSTSTSSWSACRRAPGRIRASHRRGEIGAQRLGFRQGPPSRRCVPALHDRATEVAGASGRHDVQAHAVPTGGLPVNGHVVRIAAERRDIVAHPGERRALIEEAVVARRGIRGILGGKRGVAEKPERPEAIVGRDDDRAGPFGEVPAVAVRDASQRHPGTHRWESTRSPAPARRARDRASRCSTSDSSRCPLSTCSPPG